MDSILNAVHVAGNVLLHSLRTAAFCWMAAGFVAAVLVIRGAAKKKNGRTQDSNYTLEGMSLGMCFGLLVGTILENYIGTAISLGMIVGLVIGMLIPKKAESRDR